MLIKETPKKSAHGNKPKSARNAQRSISLAQPQLPARDLIPFRLIHISLALVGLMWIFPFLHYRHEYPLTTFDQEWWAVVLGLLASFALLAHEFWRSPQIPRIVLLPVGLIVVTMLQMFLGSVAYFQQGLLYIAYLLFVALMMMLAAWLRRSLGLEKLVLALAMFLLIGAELNAAIGVLQHFAIHTWFDTVIVRKVSFSLYGNVAQPNHYANYIALGILSLGLLYQQKKPKVAYVVLLALPLLFVMTLSGSRSTWLYLFLATILAGWASYKNRSLRPVLMYMIAVLSGYVLMTFLVQLPIFSGVVESTSALRMSDTSGRIRLYLWREAMMIFMQSPWLGVGFGQFAVHHFDLVPVLKPTNMQGLYNNAHNVVFQLAAETGVAGLFVLFASAAIWFYGLRRISVTAAHWWGYAAIGVLSIHALLEYPLWYAYFLALLAVLLGVFDESHYAPKIRRAGQVALFTFLLLGGVALLQLQVSYQYMKSGLAPPTVNPMQFSVNALTKARASPLLAAYPEFFMAAYTDINPQNIKEKLAYNERVMRFIPTSEAVYRQIFLLAQDDQLEAAKTLMEKAIWSYPGNVSAHQLLLALAQKDPAHFSALLEFATQKEQEHASAVRIR